MTIVTLSTDGAASRAGDYVVHNNAWGKGIFLFGTDFTQSLTFDDTHVGDSLNFNWAWPVGDGTTVKAYPEIAWGDNPLYDGFEECHDFVSKVGDLTNFKVDVGITAGAAADYRNVSFDLWLTSDALGTASTVTSEVMVWLDKNEVTPWGTNIGTIGSGDDTASIYYVPDAKSGDRVWSYIAVVYDKPHLQGEVDLKAILDTLAAKSLISSQDYVSGYSLGAEIDGGSGSLKFDHLSESFGTKTTMADMVKTGTAGADVYNGLNGQDTLRGGAGDDSINGGANNDTIEGGAGADKLNGGAGIDTLDYKSSTAAIWVDLKTGYVGNGDAAGDWTLNFENAAGSAYNDTLDGSAGINVIWGNAGNDLIDGKAGTDTLYGGDGVDKLTGGDGNDVLMGENGTDRLTGGMGVDRLIGGAAGDLFTFLTDESTLGQMDIVTDYSFAQGDRLDVSAIDASTQKAGNQAFSFIGTSAFHGVAGELRAEIVSSNTYVYGDVNGDSVADVAFQLIGSVSLTATAFVL